MALKYFNPITLLFKSNDCRSISFTMGQNHNKNGQYKNGVPIHLIYDEKIIYIILAEPSN